MRFSLLLVICLALCSFAAPAQTRHIVISAAGGQSQKTWHGQADFQALNLEIGRALSPRTEVAFVASALSLWQPRSWFGDLYGDGNETVHALGASLLVRRRMNTNSSRLHFYAEGVAGPTWAEKAIPASTSRFNFSSEAGVGVVLMPRARHPLMIGYRFAHLSNGGYSPRNPGFNISAIVVGLQVKR